MLYGVLCMAHNYLVKIIEIILNNEIKFVGLIILFIIILGVLGIINSNYILVYILWIFFGYICFIYFIDLNKFFREKLKP
jgi:hypothetical protein